ncbi:hypothetical protein AURDEDRAFT_128116 [Auricularia subglabra TFB-10046 SS5]|uniref:F-box domain-containing protein n=1 Tax=Auricularia subglabra (strain TFB-10046 / SS5) TaxID=717982 RepID=J0D1S4_AURST|nr:hypothetical protein AURDEDRAFT_128116 [Auricularia subglabra TFB-10046 SS5]
MLPLNHDVLRAALTSEFQTLGNDVKDAAKITEILAALTNETSSILRDLVLQWSVKNNVLKTVPDELLAHCFTFLPFNGRMVVSHVSRHWRAIALSNPAVWADLDVRDSPKRTRHELFRMALARTGDHPVDLRGSARTERDRDSIVRQGLQEHLHHIRHIYWTLPADSLPLTSSAPLLETLYGIHYQLAVPSDFLGGSPQRLRTLHVSHVLLPDHCPALSTVTTLRLAGPTRLEEARTLGGLFGLFPALQSLRIDGLHEWYADYLPARPPPASLRTLELSTLDREYDLIPRYAKWRTDGLRIVKLEQGTSDPSSLADIISGSLALDIEVDYTLGRARIATHGPGADRTRSVTFIDDDDNTVPDISRLFLDSRADLRDVGRLQLPNSILASFVPVFPSLSGLHDLAVVFGFSSEQFSRGYRELPATHTPALDALDALIRVKELCPGLQKIDLQVVEEEGSPLTLRKAQELADRLAILGQTGLSGIYIEGFTEDVVSMRRTKGQSRFVNAERKDDSRRVALVRLRHLTHDVLRESFYVQLMKGAIPRRREERYEVTRVVQGRSCRPIFALNCQHWRRYAGEALRYFAQAAEGRPSEGLNGLVFVIRTRVESVVLQNVDSETRNALELRLLSRDTEQDGEGKTGLVSQVEEGESMPT